MSSINKYNNIFSCLILTLALGNSASHAFNYDGYPNNTFKFNLSGSLENKTDISYNANANDNKTKKTDVNNRTLSSIIGDASVSITKDFSIYGSLGFTNQSSNKNTQNFIKYIGIHYKQLALKLGSYYLFENTPIWFHNLATTVTFQPSDTQLVSLTYAFPEKDNLLPFNMLLADSKYLGDSYSLGIKLGYGTFNHSNKNPRIFNTMGRINTKSNENKITKSFDFSNLTAKLFVASFTANYMTDYNFNINFHSIGVKTDNSYFTINSKSDIVTNNAYNIGIYNNNSLVTKGGSSYYLSNSLAFSYVGSYSYTPELKVSYEIISQQNKDIETKFIQNSITPSLSVKIYPTTFLPISTQGSAIYSILNDSYLYIGGKYKFFNQTITYPQSLDAKTNDHKVTFFTGININF